MFEQFALIVKFGERSVRELKYHEMCKKSPNSKNCHQHTKSRIKRANLNIFKESSSKHHKQFYDCEEVRNSGNQIPPNKCCRESITISIKDIGWSNWIIRPETIDFKYCRGVCTGKIC